VSVVSALATHIPRTLIADDQPDVLVALRLLLKSAGYQTEAANSPKAVIEAIKATADNKLGTIVFGAKRVLSRPAPKKDEDGKS